MKSIQKKKLPIRRTKRWRDIDAILRPLCPASDIIRRLEREHGIILTLRAVYNWWARGISEECAPAVAAMTGKSVEEVLKASGKI